MASLASYLTAICLLGQLLTSCTAELNSSEEQCKLLPNGNDLTKEFQQKASEKGVELVNLFLEIGKDGYSPLKDHADLFLPDRWVHARFIDNPMLSLRYNYDILSLSLLNYQVRRMAVPLKDHPSGCLARLNSSSRLTKVIGRALLNVTSFSEMTNQGVVCSAVILQDDSFSFWQSLLKPFFISNVVYKCCSMAREPEGILCEQSVETPGWLQAFNTVLDVLTVITMLCCPALPLVFADSLFSFREELEKERRQEKLELFEPRNTQLAGRNVADADHVTDHQTNPRDKTEYESLDQRLVYVDDASPITCSTLLKDCLFRKHNKEPLNTKVSFNITLLICYFCIIPFVFYFHLLVYSTIKRRSFDEAMIKGAALDGFQHTYSVYYYTKGRIAIVHMLMVVIAPLFLFLLVSPDDFLVTHSINKKIYKCFLCKETISSVGEDMSKHIQKWRLNLYWFVVTLSKFYRYINILCKRCIGPCENQIRPPFKRLKKAVVVVWVLVIFGAIVIPCFVILGAVGLSFFLIYLVVLSLWFSPYISLQYFLIIKCLSVTLGAGRTSEFQVTDYIYRINFLAVLIKSAIGYVSGILILVVIWYAFFLTSSTACLLVTLSCRFVLRMIGLTVMGLVLNREIVSPFIAFFIVATGNVMYCYRNFLKGYKEVKKMISDSWQEHPELAVNISGKGAFPESLFWHICGENAIDDHKVLPISSEFIRMLRQVGSILILLFLVLCTVISFGHSYDIPALVSSMYMFASGVIAGFIFNGLNKGRRFHGAQKQGMMKSIKSAVKEYAEVLQRRQSSANGNEVDLSEVVIVQ